MERVEPAVVVEQRQRGRATHRGAEHRIAATCSDGWCADVAFQ